MATGALRIASPPSFPADKKQRGAGARAAVEPQILLLMNRLARWMPVRKSYVAGCASCHEEPEIHQRLCHHDQKKRRKWRIGWW